MAEPLRLLIPYEGKDSRFDRVGRWGKNKQFMAFVTGAFPVGWLGGSFAPDVLQNRWAEHKRWYAVLHTFDADGNHLHTEAWSGGTTAEGQTEAIERAHAKLTELLDALGPRKHRAIWVKPFHVESDGYLFGLVYERVESEDPSSPEAAEEYVLLEPNDVMFHPPWDEGEYST